MRTRFDNQLKLLHKELTEMGITIETAIGMAVGALNNRDKEAAKVAIQYDDEIDRQEKLIENHCLSLLLRQQPVASDLRFVSAGLKMITDMERIGDHAADLGELALSLADREPVMELTHIRQMAKETMVMLLQSLEAYGEQNYSTAKKVIEHDDIVDELFAKIREELIAIVREHTEYSEQVTDLLMAAKYFEKIGDHAVNIAEWVIFSITGKHR